MESSVTGIQHRLIRHLLKTCVWFPKGFVWMPGECSGQDTASARAGVCRDKSSSSGGLWALQTGGLAPEANSILPRSPVRELKGAMSACVGLGLRTDRSPAVPRRPRRDEPLLGRLQRRILGRPVTFRHVTPSLRTEFPYMRTRELRFIMLQFWSLEV